MYSHFEYAVPFEDACDLCGAAFKNGGNVLQRRVQLPVDGLERAALAHLPADVEAKACLSLVDRHHVWLENPRLQYLKCSKMLVKYHKFSDYLRTRGEIL